MIKTMMLLTYLEDLVCHYNFQHIWDVRGHSLYDLCEGFLEVSVYSAGFDLATPLHRRALLMAVAPMLIVMCRIV